MSRCEICGITLKICTDCGDVYCKECDWHDCEEETK